jgi:hypothetical protein
MNANNVIRPPKRIDTSYLMNLNIQSYGIDNLYPQRMYDIVQNSPTGAGCVDRYQTFIEGNGLRNTQFSEYVCNRKGETIDDVFRLLAQDIALYRGFALHVNYNAACEIVELQHVPFQDCRLEEEDEDGQVLYVNVHPDWTGESTRKGKKLTVDRKTVKKIFMFNPIQNVVMSQIVKSGGIDAYLGQILWVSMDGRYQYPKPIYDKVVTCLSTDEGLDNVKYRNVRNGFMLSGMFIHKKGIQFEMDENGNTIEKQDEYDFSKSLDVFQGDSNCCSIMDITLNSDDDKPEFVNVEGKNYDAKFTCTETSVVERIYSAFGQEPWYCIRTGKLGFSGTVLAEAYEYYNSLVNKERRTISRALKRIFDKWFEVANPSQDYEIEPLPYVSNQSVDLENETTPNNN